MHLFRAEIVKVRTTRLWIGLAIGAIGFTVLVSFLLLSVAESSQGAAQGLTPITTAEDLRSFLQTSGVAMPFVLVLAATMATVEYRYGTATLTYLLTPSRTKVFAGKVSAAAVVGLILQLAAVLAGLLAAIAWVTIKGRDLPLDASLAGTLGQIALHAAYGAVLALAFGVLVRSQVVSILSLLGWFFILEPLLVSLVPKLARWTPFTGVDPLFGADSNGAPLFAWQGALALAIGYMALLSVAAVLVERRRDV